MPVFRGIDHLRIFLLLKRPPILDLSHHQLQLKPPKTMVRNCKKYDSLRLSTVICKEHIALCTYKSFIAIELMNTLIVRTTEPLASPPSKSLSPNMQQKKETKGLRRLLKLSLGACLQQLKLYMPKFCHLNNLHRKRHIKASFGYLVRILLNAIETGCFHWSVNTDYDKKRATDAYEYLVPHRLPCPNSPKSK